MAGVVVFFFFLFLFIWCEEDLFVVLSVVVDFVHFGFRDPLFNSPFVYHFRRGGN